jgi:hypothetical protein
LCNRTPQRIWMHVVDETPPPVDLHHRDPFAVRSLELGIAVDLNLPEFEAELVARSRDDALGRRAEVATRGREKSDFGYG